VADPVIEAPIGKVLGRRWVGTVTQPRRDVSLPVVSPAGIAFGWGNGGCIMSGAERPLFV